MNAQKTIVVSILSMYFLDFTLAVDYYLWYWRSQKLMARTENENRKELSLAGKLSMRYHYRKIIARQWISNTLNREKESGQVTEEIWSVRNKFLEKPSRPDWNISKTTGMISWIPSKTCNRKKESSQVLRQTERFDMY